MQTQNTNIIVTWFNTATRRPEYEIFEKAASELACKYANMIKSDKNCIEVKLYGATPLVEV